MGTKPPPPPAPLTAFQRAQKRLGEVASSVASEMQSRAETVAKEAGRGLKAADKNWGISESATRLGAQVADQARELDARHGVTKVVGELGKQAGEALRSTAEAVTAAADSAGVTRALDEYAVTPGRKLAEAVSSSQAYKSALTLGEEAYGAVRGNARALVHPSLPTFDQDTLLKETGEELVYIAACLMQISAAESHALGSQFGRAVFAKASGAAAVAGTLSLVAAFGTSGTGTAIAALHGAALSSASLAWVGGLVGGGMAAGAVLTGGVGLVAGLGAYKMLASERRPFEALSATEQSIVQSCWALATLCGEYRAQPAALDLPAVIQLLDKALRPLFERVSSNLETLCAALDAKNALALRQHAMPDFKSVVLERWILYVSWLHSDAGQAWLLLAKDPQGEAPDTRQLAVSEGEPAAARAVPISAQLDARAKYAIGGVFAALLSREPLDDSVESQLVVEAMQRSVNALHDATPAQLGDYLRGLSEVQQRGFASGVKGIYHELYFAHDYNDAHADTFARLHEQTNHPGSDLEIVDAQTGEVLQERQLKAVASSSHVTEHLDRYPDIDVRVTDEVAARFDDERVVASGFDNDSLRSDVDQASQTLQDHTVLNRAEHSALVAAGIGTVEEIVEMMRGQRQFPDAVRRAASKAGIAAAATAMAAFLFG
ncbi:MAG: hypothetical protein IPJ08_09145 [Burkholderiales bacterium]|nr:hypothetical protein [Burkholderiales bacterium]